METIGQRLKKKREENNLSLDDAYKATKVHPRILMAIEEDRAEESLSRVYVRNFLFDYAKFLGLNANEVVDEYLKQTPSPIPSALASHKKTKFYFNLKNIKLKRPLIIVIIVVLIGGLILIRARRTSTLKTEEKLAKEANSHSAEKIGFPTIKRSEELNLVLRAKKKVWLQVKTDGKVVFENILEKGDIKHWRAKEKLELWVGNGNALELELNGQHLGSLSSGVIKDIVLDHEGMRIGGK